MRLLVCLTILLLSLLPAAAFAEAPEQVLELGETVEMRTDPWLELYPLIDQFQNSKAE